MANGKQSVFVRFNHSILGLIVVHNIRYVTAASYRRHGSAEGVIATMRNLKGQCITVRLSERDKVMVDGLTVQQLNEIVEEFEILVEFNNNDSLSSGTYVYVPCVFPWGGECYLMFDRHETMA